MNLNIPNLVVAGRLRSDAPPGSSSRWQLDTAAGRLVEISSGGPTASLTIAVGLVLEAQQQGEPAAWITASDSIFFPPDLDASGIDLQALPVVRVNDPPRAARAADVLVRSGGLALIVIDLGPAMGLPVPVQTRLAGLAKKHHTALVCLTRKGAHLPSLGSLVSLRGEGATTRTSFNRFTWEIRIVKDKRRGPGWRHAEVCRGPDGLC
jgi:recombination protein RecA